MKHLALLFTVIIFTACSSNQQATTEKTSQEPTTSKYQIHDIWLLETINGNPIKKAGEGNKTPQLEIFVDKKQVVGNDGCNQISGGLKALDEKNITFGMLRGTKMMCPDMETTNLFNKALPLVKTYKIDKLKLYFYDVEGNEILQFKKID